MFVWWRFEGFALGDLVGAFMVDLEFRIDSKYFSLVSASRRTVCTKEDQLWPCRGGTLFLQSHQTPFASKSTNLHACGGSLKRDKKLCLRLPLQIATNLRKYHEKARAAARNGFSQ